MTIYPEHMTRAEFDKIYLTDHPSTSLEGDSSMAADTTVVNQTFEAPVQNAVDFDDAQAIIEHIPALISETKAGYKTTEFWVAIVISILTVVDAIPLPQQYEGLVVALLGAAYALSRGFAKKGIPHVEESPVSVKEEALA